MSTDSRPCRQQQHPEDEYYDREECLFQCLERTYLARHGCQSPRIRSVFPPCKVPKVILYYPDQTAKQKSFVCSFVFFLFPEGQRLPDGTFRLMSATNSALNM